MVHRSQITPWKLLQPQIPACDPDYCPPPGIYVDVPFPIYLGWRAISNSSLNQAMRSMAHYRLQEPVEETQPMRFGTLCHTGRFEPLEIAQRYVVMPPFERDIRKPDGSLYDNVRGTKQYKELVATFREANKTKVVVEQREYDNMLGVVKSLARHERACEFLEGCEHEVAVVWRDPVTDLLCKGRVDAWRPDVRIADLKTTADAGEFENAIANRFYHRQLPFYNDGFKTHGYGDHQLCLVAAESVGPVYAVRAKPLPAAAIDQGRKLYRQALDQIAACVESNDWPSYESDGEWTLPAWAVPDTMRVENGVLTSW